MHMLLYSIVPIRIAMFLIMTMKMMTKKLTVLNVQLIMMLEDTSMKNRASVLWIIILMARL